MAVIGKIRKNFGWGVTVIVALATLAFIFNDFGKRNTRVNKLASVDGMEIGIAEFDSARENTENELRMRTQDGRLTNEQQFQVKAQAYYELVSEKLLNRECDKLGIVIGEEEMNDMFLGTFLANSVKQAFTDPTTGQFNAQNVRQVMQQYDKMTAEQQAAWNQMQKAALSERMNNKYASVIAGSFYMPKAMAKHISNTYDQVADVRYALLPFSNIEDDKVKLSDEDYKKYYEEHKKEFRLSEEMRQVEFVKFEVIPSQSDIKALEDSVQKVFNELASLPKEDMEGFISTSFDNNYDSNYYSRDAQNIKSLFPDTLLAGKGAGSMIEPRISGNNWIMGKILSEQSRPDSIKFSILAVYNNKTGAAEIKRSPEEQRLLVDSLMSVIKDSAQFVDNVAKFSDDPNTKSKLGDMGWVTDGTIMESMYQPMLNCPVGGVFRYMRPDSVGEYIIRVTDKTVAKPKIQLASVVIGIRPSEQTILSVKGKADDFLAKSKDLVAMKSLAEKQNINVNTSSLTAMSYQLDGTPYAREAVCWAFGDVKKGDVSNTVYELQDFNQYNTMFVVLGLKDIQEKGFMSLEQLKENPQFERLVKMEKKAQMLLAQAEKSLKTANDINAYASANKTVVDTVTGIDFSSPYFGKAGVEMRLIGTVSAAKNTGLQKKAIKGFNGVYVLQIDKISKRPVKEDFNAVCQTYNMRIQQRLQQVNPIALLYRDAKVKNNFVQYVSK
ncbi:MAG: SurA N-terminal domain-containing protein [Bacteroidales bacterium]|nr:SurA N-terminal domain-containing protein [Bacteroidales bacterium]